MIGDETVEQSVLETGFKATFQNSDALPIIHYEGNIDGEEVERVPD